MTTRWTHHPLPGGWTLATRATDAWGTLCIPTPPGGDPETAPSSAGYLIDNADQLAALLGTVAAEIADGSAPVRYAAAAPAAPAPAPASEPAPVDPPRSAPGTVAPFTARAATTGDLFAQDTRDPDRTFADRAAAVRYARQLSERGTPCDVYDGAGDLVYTRAMDVAAGRAQLGLFS